MSDDAPAKPNATDLAVQRTDMAENRTGMAEKRTDMAGERTRWAADRTLWAADRTFIAWLRTSISMIGFGITIGKAGEALAARDIISDPYSTLQIVGVAFIVLAVVGLIGALVQNFRIEKRLAAEGYARVEPVPLGLTMGILVLAFSVLSILFVVL